MPLQQLFLIRHGQSEANVNTLQAFKNNPDYNIPLTQLGHNQAKKVGDFLFKTHSKLAFNRGTTAVWNSSFKRARQTKDGLLQGFKESSIDKYGHEVPLNEHMFESNLIVEQQFGLFPYYSKEDIQKHFPKEKNTIRQHVETAEGKFWANFPCGESMAQVEVRVALFMRDLKEDALNLGYDTAMVVAHGTTLRVLAAYLLRQSFETLNDKKDNPENCSIRHLIFNRTWQDKGYIYTPS